MSLPEQIFMMSVEEAINQGIEWCKQNGKPPSEIVTPEVLDMLSADAFREFARRGFIQSLGGAFSDERSPSRPGRRVITGRNPTVNRDVLASVMMGADGSMKPILLMEPVDIDWLFSDAAARENAWARRKGFFRLVRDEFDSHPEARTIKDFPEDVIDGLRAEAEAVWS